MAENNKSSAEAQKEAAAVKAAAEAIMDQSKQSSFEFNHNTSKQ